MLSLTLVVLSFCLTEDASHKQPSRVLILFVVSLHVFHHAVVEEGLINTLAAAEPHLLVVHRLLVNCQTMQSLCFKLTNATV